MATETSNIVILHREQKGRKAKHYTLLKLSF